MDKLSNMQALVTVVETGSFSKAAERLGIAKSVVSRRVSALEDDLGVQLLRRTTRSLSLTDPGRQFHERATQILYDLDDAEQSIAAASAAPRGRIRLAAPLSFGLHHLSAALNAFLDTHPEIRIELDLNDREVNLVEEGFDMAVRIGELGDSTLLARRIGTARFVTCASPEYLARHGTPQTPDELDRHLGLHYSNLPLQKAWTLAQGGQRKPALPRIRLQANNGDALVAAASAGLGIVISPTFIVAEFLRRGQLVEILADFKRPAVPIHAVYPPGRLPPHRVQVFTAFLRERFGDRPYWEEGLGIWGEPGAD